MTKIDHSFIVSTMQKLAHHNTIRSISLLLALLSPLLSCTGTHPVKTERPLDQGGKTRIHSSSLERQIHVLINKERRKHGLTILELSDTLSVIARKHSQDMAIRNYFAHSSPEGHDFLYRYEQAGYQCAVRVNRIIYQGAENLALNHLYDSVTTVNGKSFYDWNSSEKIAETTVQGWMKSAGHRKNILTPYFKQEGIGVVTSPDDKVYITQNFC